MPSHYGDASRNGRDLLNCSRILYSKFFSFSRHSPLKVSAISFISVGHNIRHQTSDFRHLIRPVPCHHLSLFTDEKVSSRLLKEVEKYNSLEGYSELKKVRDLIESQQGKLLYKPKKQIGRLELKK